uniref:heavy-metal-associated domain-containing protein n=1 Tax=Falsirhodobacter deserti TaxID=1365611 RepID=UPI001F4D404F
MVGSPTLHGTTILKEMTMHLHIAKMACGGCLGTITETIRGLDPAATVEADMPARNIEVRSTASQAEIQAALAKAGYPAQAA